MTEAKHPFRRPESVLVVVYTSAGEVLLLRRVKPDNYWQSVTGSLEKGEAPMQAASRELLEETGLQDQAIVDCGWQNEFEIYPERLNQYEPGVRYNRESVFKVLLPSRIGIHLNPQEHSEYCWLPFEKAALQVRSSTNKEAILKIKK